MDKCVNCEQPIGNLEIPHVFRDQVVCAACHAKLDPPAPAPTATTQQGTLTQGDITAGVFKGIGLFILVIIALSAIAAIIKFCG